ncbi:uncharacterized protein [Typha angustifolia]|uniref:uncharacterized protein n=1 Tax=Typha angustifolia TaxID=59011 RepID=UPI003C2DAD09
MASLSGILHRPLPAAAAVAVAAAASSDAPDRFSHRGTSDPNSSSTSTPPPPSTSANSSSWLRRLPTPSLSHVPNSIYTPSSCPFASPPVIQSLYHYANLVKRHDRKQDIAAIPSQPSDVMYKWHLPDPAAGDRCSSKTVVVLLGWLGAKQKHLKRYADWYTSRGFHVVTFTFPMYDVVSYKIGGTAEQSIRLLAKHLGDCVAEESEKKLVFHTFSNTGWLTYGVLLEEFRKNEPSVMEKIKGCVFDSAPVAAPDPQVWASGFSAAFLKKQSIATKGMLKLEDLRTDVLVADSFFEPKPPVFEAALLVVLEKFFDVVLNVPGINRRLCDVLDLLSSKQPKCPQLYIYSSADRVIPAKSVESFIEAQRKAGHEVRACDFVSSPHVDHFRSHPDLYTSQLTKFLEDYVLSCCKDSS